MSKFAEGMGSMGNIVDDPEAMGSKGFILPFDVSFVRIGIGQDKHLSPSDLVDLLEDGEVNNG
jgi:hypothetical protein